MRRRRVNSLRMPGFDYAQPAYYFITINVKNRKPILGEVKNDQMILSPLGQLVEDTWKAIPSYYANITLHRYQVMPDHFHGIIQITKEAAENKTISHIVNQFKGTVTKKAKVNGLEIPQQLWLRSFWSKTFWMYHDLAKIEKYIEDNPRNYPLKK